MVDTVGTAQAALGVTAHPGGPGRSRVSAGGRVLEPGPLMAPDGSPGCRLRLRRRAAEPPVVLDDEQRAVVEHDRGRLRVLGGPGTGKSTALVEAVADRVRRPAVDPDQILVLTFSRQAAAELSDRIAHRTGRTTGEPLVRTLHSYAFALLRRDADRTGEAAPRLLVAGDSDQMVRELLAGHAAEGGGPWPPSLWPALTSARFAASLRDLMMRAAERGLSPARIAEWGRRRHRPEWQAAGAFAREYQDVADLRQGSSGFGAALDQAELTTAALAVLRDDTALASEQRRFRRILVDEYQDVDPAQAALVERLADGADEFVVFGDPDQSVFGFRGSDREALQTVSVDRTIVLSTSHRLPEAVIGATRRLADRLPGPAGHRTLRLPTTLPESTLPPSSGGPLHPPRVAVPAPAVPVPGPSGSVEVRILASAASEAAFVADELRRAHIHDGVPWSRMAVLMRSPSAGITALRRACSTAGVPLVTQETAPVLQLDPTVRAMVLVLRCAADPVGLTAERATELLTGPLGGLDAIALRRLRRAIRSRRPAGPTTADELAATLLGAPLPDSVADPERTAVHHLSGMLDAARAQIDATDAEQPLWAVWELSGLADSLLADVLAGGRSGARADATLDAVVTLFRTAADFAERLPMAGVAAFLELIDQKRLADADPARRVGADGVRVVSAHGAKGLQWDVVAVSGVQESRWPDLRSRPDLLGAGELLAAASGLPSTVSVPAATLADERRLFYVACTRAGRRLLVTAVRSASDEPSRFLAELVGADAEILFGWPVDRRGRRRRGTQLTDLVAELRRAVVDPEEAPGTAARAAEQLARLATAGVPGAHPGQWWGLAGTSTDEPALPTDRPVPVSPSAVERITTCELRGVLQARGGGGPTGTAQVEGILLHALVQGLADGVPREELVQRVDDFLTGQSQLAGWLRARTRRGLLTMLDAAEQWLAENQQDRTPVGAELEVVAEVPGGPETPAARIAGRMDWLSRRSDGSLVVTDFKTGASVPTRAQVAEHAQLGAYQVALADGAGARTAGTDADPGRVTGAPGGAELVYLRSGRPKVLAQPPLTEEQAQRWRELILDSAGALTRTALTATENRGCERCPVRSSCPLRDEGRQVTR
ncbi:ATP-dependent helicase [Nakamurella leprariae]|uniref:DNA 3'-5' helicase n=1 Tax=Nakamurella leprariae TaxID=2803911 RepID=A0A938YC61_9ACTN|nr:ATP-dependent DNA helicase [Nakamurella leprariae]MBM9465787.1 ATP-dependent helicase [Nakamurella leprariae]